MFKAGTALRAAIQMTREGSATGPPPAALVIAAHVPAGARRNALVDLHVCDAEGVPTAEACQGLADWQAKIDFVRHGTDADAAARYAGWAANRAADMRAEAARALEDLEEEFSEESLRA